MVALLVAGVDEAGRGPLAGPVVAAAVILNPSYIIKGIKDSKKLAEPAREELYELIIAHALDFAIAKASAAEIDKLNILQATMLAMQRAVAKLTLPPSEVLVDGNRCPQLAYPTRAIVKGDSLITAISAASILAKVTRDRCLYALHAKYPQYNFAKHKGYPTAAHIAALAQYGPCKEHRQSFRPVQLARMATEDNW